LIASRVATDGCDAHHNEESEFAVPNRRAECNIAHK